MKGEIKLGQKVRCRVTGFTGIVTAIASYAHMCNRVLVAPPVDKDGDLPEEVQIDEPQLEVLEEPTFAIPTLPKQRIRLGDKVRDPFSEYAGIAMGRTVYINGCSRILVHPRHTASKEKFDSGIWFPEGQLEVKKPVAKKNVVKEVSTGGPADHCASPVMSRR
jgi:hypothetical protein